MFAAVLSLLVLSGCAIAFTPGLKPAPAPAKFVDDSPPSREEQKKEGFNSTASSPAFGMSLVIGGHVMDSGSLPKPPIPVVLLP
jgi:hypothetical protein